MKKKQSNKMTKPIVLNEKIPKGADKTLIAGNSIIMTSTNVSYDEFVSAGKKAKAPSPRQSKRDCRKATGKSPSVSKNSVKKAVSANHTKTTATTPAKTEASTEKRRVYKSLPKGYSVVQGTVAQSDGTILIHNGKPLFKQNKDGTKQQAKDSRGKPAHKIAKLVIDPKAFNNAKNAERASAVGEIHRGNTKYIDTEPKQQRDYAVVKDKNGKVTVAKVKTIKKIDENGKNADHALVEINHQKYGLKNRSGVDFETFDQNRMTHKPLQLSDKDAFPEQQPRAKLNSKDKHNVLVHTKVINDPKKKKGGNSK